MDRRCIVYTDHTGQYPLLDANGLKSKFPVQYQHFNIELLPGMVSILIIPALENKAGRLQICLFKARFLYVVLSVMELIDAGLELAEIQLLLPH